MPSLAGNARRSVPHSLSPNCPRRGTGVNGGFPAGYRSRRSSGNRSPLRREGPRSRAGAGVREECSGSLVGRLNVSEAVGDKRGAGCSGVKARHARTAVSDEGRSRPARTRPSPASARSGRCANNRPYRCRLRNRQADLGGQAARADVSRCGGGGRRRAGRRSWCRRRPSSAARSPAGRRSRGR
jgi:hypothetical protein